MYSTSTKVTALVPQCSCKVWCREHREPLLQSVGTVGLFPPAGFYFTHKKKKAFSVIYSGYFGLFPPAGFYFTHKNKKAFSVIYSGFILPKFQIILPFLLMLDLQNWFLQQMRLLKLYWGPFTRFKYSNLLIATGNCIIVETKNSFSIFSTFAC